ncbi:Zinc finger C2H2-type [Cinara cedri]|uniref:Zinc finger C2H2-type n=1 Tax=Cinara cedri TaxID=506608 RepID=A0A5E4NKN9_9HEMI|nr:Zinc finger C2H2-type [Cinara cedri]
MNTFKCTFIGCEKVFNVKRSMTRHAKSHDGVKIKCALCHKSFSRKYNFEEHVKIAHRDGRVASPTIAPQAGPLCITPGSSTQTWITDDENDALLAVVCQAIDDMEGFENEGRKRALREDTAARVKKARMELVNTPGFTEIDSTIPM